MFTLIVLGGVATPATPLGAMAPAINGAVAHPGTGERLAPESDVLVFLEGVGGDLTFLRLDIERGLFPDVTPEQLDLLDDLQRRHDEFLDRSDRVTLVELDEFLGDYDTLFGALLGDPGFLAPPPAAPTAPTGSGTPATPAPATAPSTSIAPTTPATTVVTTPPTTIAEIAPTTPIEVADGAPAAETATAPTTPSAPLELPSTSPPAGSISTDRLVSILLGVLGLTALLAVAAYVVDRWRRRRLPIPSGRPGLHDLLDVSRRLAAAGTIDEVEILAVRQAMRLTDADAGAFVRRGDRVASVSYETNDDLLVPDRLNEGALDRVLAAGHELIQTTSVEPAIRQVPVSLLAMPVFNSGAVFGAIVLLRNADEPFGTDERRMASDLKSIVGAAIEHAEHTERVRAEALADGLTGVRNRRALDLDVADLADRRFSAVMVDLDHFKQVNDTHGHQAGDELLHAVAQRILANVRPIDEVYRYGGEEFAIVMPDTETATAGDIADRVRVALASAPFTIGPERTVHQATASLGVATGADGQSVFARADEALYAAKHGGRNRVVVAKPAPMPAPMPAPAASDVVAQPSV